MNKKGFAISVILYSIIFMIITILLILLGLVRTRYTVSESLREKVIEDVNNVILKETNPSNYSCEITANSSDYTTNLILSINIIGGNANSYSYDGINYVANNSTLVNHSGVYTGYFKDTEGRIGSCSANIISQTVYRSRSCSPSNRTFSAWYFASDRCYNGCSARAKGTAESNYETEYRNCTTRSDLCSNSPYDYEEVYRRTVTGCNWDNETSSWSDWTTERINATETLSVDIKMSYKMAS